MMKKLLILVNYTLRIHLQDEMYDYGLSRMVSCGNQKYSCCISCVLYEFRLSLKLLATRQMRDNTVQHHIYRTARL